jgi:hypothetical protein
MHDEPLPDVRRRELFSDLIHAQDEGMSPAASRMKAARRYGLTEAEVRDVEDEGVDAGWQPL